MKGFTHEMMCEFHSADSWLLLIPQDDQRLPQEVCTPTLQGARVDKGWVGVSGPLCSQIPGSSREAGTQAHRALRPGWRNDEEGGRGERIVTTMKGNHVKHCGETVVEWGWNIWSL